MPRPQFTLRALLMSMLVVAVVASMIASAQFFDSTLAFVALTGPMKAEMD